MRLAWLLVVLPLCVACEPQGTTFPENLRKPPEDNAVVMPDGTTRNVVAPTKHPLYLIIDTEPRNDYERALPLMMNKIVNVDALQQFCGQWYPDYGRGNADAYMAWRKKHEATIGEITARSEAVWAEYSQGQTGYVRMVYPHLRSQMRKAIDAEYNTAPVDRFKKVCSQLPEDLRTKWDLDKRFKKELAFLRKTPFKSG